MSSVTGTKPTTKKQYLKLVAPFLDSNVKLLALWKRNAKNDPADLHSKMLVEAGKEYLKHKKQVPLATLSTEVLAPRSEVEKAIREGVKFTHLV